MFSLKTKFNRRKSQAGFTLIEMMVAVSIFAIVAFIVVSTLLTMSYAYKKAQKMRLIMDNFNFALQAMSLGIREGTNYSTFRNCSSGSGTCFQFTEVLDPNSPTVCYDLRKTETKDERGAIFKCTDCPCGDEDPRFTSPDINVTNLSFSIEEGVIPKVLAEQSILRNKVKIIISGKAGRLRDEVSFFIQSTVAQRNPM